MSTDKDPKASDMRKGIAGATSDDGKPKAGSGSGEPPPGDMQPDTKNK